MLHARVTGRDPDEEHRASTPLELFFDLTFVVAISQAASSLHHELVDGDARNAVIMFPLVFFAVWWAWVNFTWFASAYDTDDAIYRLWVFVQMAGVLILAAGIPRAFSDHDFGIAVAGYVVMRLALVAQWLRVAWSVPEAHGVAIRYAVGLTVLQVGWIAWLAVPDGLFVPGFLVLAVAEIGMPIWAERAARTSWHPGHIAERYGLFTIIVLGESVLAATVGVQQALDGDGTLGELFAVVFGGLFIVFAMWWAYFDLPAEHVIGRARASFDQHMGGAFLWGYLHYFVFAGAAATGVGLSVAVDQAVGHSELTDVQAALTLTIPVSAYLLAVWILYFRDKVPRWLRRYGTPTAVALILASSVTSVPVLVTGIVLGALVAVSIVAPERESRPRS